MMKEGERGIGGSFEKNFINKKKKTEAANISNEIFIIFVQNNLSIDYLYEKHFIPSRYLPVSIVCKPEDFIPS